MASAQPEIVPARKPPLLKLITPRSAVELLNAQKVSTKALKAGDNSSRAATAERSLPIVQKRIRQKSKTPDPGVQATEIQPTKSSADKPVKKVPKLILKLPVQRNHKRDLKAMGQSLADSVYNDWPKHQQGRHKYMPDCVGFWELDEQRLTSHKQVEEMKADLRDFQTRIPLLEDLLAGDFLIERKKKRRRRRRSVVKTPEQ